jgi:hypothetical protein
MIKTCDYLQLEVRNLNRARPNGAQLSFRFISEPVRARVDQQVSCAYGNPAIKKDWLDPKDVKNARSHGHTENPPVFLQAFARGERCNFCHTKID